MTLTCSRRQYPSPLVAFRSLSQAIPVLMKRLRRSFPDNRIEYFCVWESTASGWPHVHVLFRGPYIPQRCLSSHWQELTGSPVVDIRRVYTRAQVASYLSKYLTKQPDVPYGHRRFRTSRAFWQGDSPGRRNPNPTGERWRLRRDSLFTLAQVWSNLGFIVTFDHPGSLTAFFQRPPPISFPEVPRDVQTPLRSA